MVPHNTVTILNCKNMKTLLTILFFLFSFLGYGQTPKPISQKTDFKAPVTVISPGTLTIPRAVTSYQATPLIQVQDSFKRISWLPSWADITGKPALGSVTSVSTGLGLAGGAITTSGTISLDTTNATVLSRQRAANTYQTKLGYTPYNATNPAGYTTSTGTVTSVGSGLGLTGTITTSGTLALDTANATVLSRQRASNTYQVKGDYAPGSTVSNATHTGDVTGSTALTLATVNSNVGTFNNITINAKGLATAGSNISYVTGTPWASMGYLTSETSHADVLQDADFSAQGIMLRGASTGNYSILTNNSSNWNNAYTDRLKWDGGSTGLTASTGRASLGLGSIATLDSTKFLQTKDSISIGDALLVNLTTDSVATKAYARSVGGSGGLDSIPELASAPSTGNIYISSSSHRLWIKGGGYWRSPTWTADSVAVGGGTTKTLVDSYSTTNRDESHALSSTQNDALGQCFTPNASGTLESVKFMIYKTGSPTGNAVAKLYAITGTYGTNGVPTGTALATSDNFDVSTTTADWITYEITFSGGNKYSMTSGTQYAISIEWNGGDESNYIEVGIDSTSPIHGGNHYALDGGSYWEYSTQDIVFEVYANVPN